MQLQCPCCAEQFPVEVQALAAFSKRPQAGGPSTQQLLKDQVGRVQSDIVLGLITKEDEERQIAALKGEHEAEFDSGGNSP